MTSMSNPLNISQRAWDELEIFTQHGGSNDDELEAWRRFIAYNMIDGPRVSRDRLRDHLRTERDDDTEEKIAKLLDEYEEALRVLKTFAEIIHWQPSGN